MRPLNVRDVIWIEGTADEVDKFLHNPDIENLGHADNVRILLGMHPEPHTMPSVTKYLAQKTVPAAFVLLQGKIIGLLCEPAKLMEVPV